MINHFKIYLIIAFLLCFCCGLLAKTDRYRVSWREDPSTSMVIAWDQVSGNNPILYYGVADDVRAYDKYTFSKDQFYVVKSKGMKNHFARLKHLLPNTVYAFEIRDSEGASRKMSFKTASSDPYTRLSIIAGGDSRNNRDARRNANLIVAKLRPDFVLFAGDMTGGDSSKEWRNWMDDWQMTIARDGRITPIVAARGNHEFSNRSIIEMFDVKNMGVFYALTFGGNLLRVYTLNSLIAVGGDQALWLEKDLSMHQNVIWKTAQYHFPIRPHTKRKKERNGQRKYWATLFQKYGVQLGVECDAHVVKSTYPIIPSTGPGSQEGFIRDDAQGTVYIGEGCWGAPLRRNNDDKNWTRASGSFNQVKWLFVDQNEIQIRTVKTDGASQVAYLKDYTKFEIPRGIELWEPNTGAIIKIKNKSRSASLPIPPKPVEKEKPEETPRKTNPNSKKSKTKSKMLSIKDLRVEIAKAVIPTEIVNFLVKKEGMDIAIQWEAINDKASTSYELQRLQADGSFKTIALIAGREKEQNSYEIPDKNAVLLYPDALYRLHKKNENGQSTLFQGKILYQSKGSEFGVYKRNEEGFIQFPYNLEADGWIQFKILDTRQKELKSESIQQAAGNYLKTIDISDLTKGKYILSIQVKQSIKAKHLLIVE